MGFEHGTSRIWGLAGLVCMLRFGFAMGFWEGGKRTGLEIGREERFSVLDPNDHKHYFPSQVCYNWAKTNVPFIDFPDIDIMRAYYYRWCSYRKHIKNTKSIDGFVVSEFKENVPWAGLHNTISAAAGHHIMEGRWIKNQKILDDYIRFWFLNAESKIDRYTNWIIWASLERSKITGNTTILRQIYPKAVGIFFDVYVPKYLSSSPRNKKDWPGGRHCWRQTDDRDAMEVSVSGSGCRTSIASVMYGEASALAEIARICKDPKRAEIFSKWASFSRSVLLEQNWNPKTGFFSTIPSPKRPLVPDSVIQLKGECDLNARRTPNKTVDVRELFGFMPWYYSDPDKPLIPLSQARKYSHMFNYLLPEKIEEGFYAKWGLRTLPKADKCYNYSYTHGDCWNGPSWPFETSRVLHSLAGFLNEYKSKKELGLENETPKITSNLFGLLLRQYARQHTRTYAVNDTALTSGSGHIFENLHPDYGYWNNRNIMYSKQATNKDMGDDYNHSVFCDLVLSGLLGIRNGRTESGIWMVINPLLDPAFTTHFIADGIRYKGHDVTVIYNQHTRGEKLRVLVDGVLVAYRDTLGRLEVTVEAISDLKNH